MDKDNIVGEINGIVANLDAEDETSKEYTIMVNNMSKLHQIMVNDQEFDLKKDQKEFEQGIRKDQLDLDKRKHKLEKDRLQLDREKFEEDKLRDAMNRDIEKTRLNNQHIEKMAEIEVNRIKAENEKKILEQGQIKSEREFKANRRRDWLTFGGKALMLFMIVGVNVLMHKDELRFERDENGIIPQRCKTYDAITNKAAEMVMK